MKVMLAGNGFAACDAISYQGSVWLVPQWLVADQQGMRRPEWIVCLDGLLVQSMPDGGQVVLSSIPPALLTDPEATHPDIRTERLPPILLPVER